jgi:hypothetical protein
MEKAGFPIEESKVIIYSVGYGGCRTRSEGAAREWEGVSFEEIRKVEPVEEDDEDCSYNEMNS